MRAILACLLLGACAHPSPTQLAETPIAKTTRIQHEAPPASNSDAERYQLNQEFRDMKDANEAYEEASVGAETVAPPQGGPGIAAQAAPPEAPPAPSPPRPPAIPPRPPQ